VTCKNNFYCDQKEEGNFKLSVLRICRNPERLIFLASPAISLPALRSFNTFRRHQRPLGVGSQKLNV